MKEEFRQFSADITSFRQIHIFRARTKNLFWQVPPATLYYPFLWKTHAVFPDGNRHKLD